MKRVFALFSVILLCLGLCACGRDGTKIWDGYYTAEAADYDEYGWKDYISIYVSNGTIVTVEYNSKNSSGFVKSWDMNYMRAMKSVTGTYPNKYAREYVEALLNRQSPEYIDVIAGATTSHDAFRILAQAAIEQAKTGSEEVVFVDLSVIEE